MHRLTILTLATLAGTASAAPADAPQSLRMNDIQVIGSHNSFKARIPAAVMAGIEERAPDKAKELDYYHMSLGEQLDRGVRQLEIDIFADPDGGHYADPAGERAAEAAGQHTGFDRAAMLKPGFKVFHIPDIDYLSTCATLKRCLGEINDWSAAHPHHLPIMITINAADMAQPWDVTKRISLDDSKLLDALDAEIRAAIPGKRLVTPDEVRGGAPNLAKAIAVHGWPSLETTRGRVFILFDVRPKVSEAYCASHPALAGRAMFGWYKDGDPDAAVQIVQDPLVDGARIREWVKRGIIVRTRSDANTVEARTHDMTKAQGAYASGAQAVSTDYYPGAPDPMHLNFRVALPGGEMVRCNPVRIVVTCALKP